MENDYCNRCGECCKNIKADFETKTLFWDEKTVLTDEFSEMLIKNGDTDTYYCKYLKNNLCTNPNKPQICIAYPSFPFVKLCENCTYDGFIFTKKEKIKQKIRKLKEEILHYETIIKTTSDKKEHNRLNKIISSHQKYIEKYSPFGSEDW